MSEHAPIKADKAGDLISALFLLAAVCLVAGVIAVFSLPTNRMHFGDELSAAALALLPGLVVGAAAIISLFLNNIHKALAQNSVDHTD